MASVSLCGSVAQNTGEILCDVSKGVGKKLFIFNGEFAEADYATQVAFETKIEEFSKLSKSAANKIFPIPEMQDIVDASEANTEGTLGLGFTTIIREGRPAYTIKSFAGSTLAKALRKYNNQTIRFLEYDANGRVWGTKQGTKFKGYLGKLFFTGQKLATGQAVEEGIVTYTLSIMDTSEYNDNSYYMDISNVTSIVGLLDVQLSEAVASVSNVYTIAVKVPTSKIGESVNLYDQLATLLNDDALWVATNAQTGAAMTITSVTADATNKAFDVTIDSTQHTALGPSDKIILSLAAPNVLDAADVTNIESDTLIVDK